MNVTLSSHALILDMDVARSAAISAILKERGYNVAQLQGVGAALAVCTRVPFTVILLGSVPPDHDRGAVCRALRQASSSAIIGLVDDSSPAEVTPLLDAGASDVLPFSPSDPDRLLLRVLVTERRAAAQSHAEAMLRAMPDMVFRIHASGEMLSFHASNTGDLYASPEAIVGRRISEMLPPDIARLCMGGMHRAIDSGEIQVVTYTLDLPTGAQHFEARLVPAGPDEVVGVVRNITERAQLEQRAAEAERQRMQDRLWTSQRFGSLGLLAGGVAHDFNNLLTAILGSASVALLKLPDDGPARRSIETLVTAAQRASELTQKLLAYSGRGKIEIRPLDLSEQVRELLLVLHAAIPKQIELRLRLAPELPAVQADAAQIQQVIINLVINAAEAIGDSQGTIVVTTGQKLVDDTFIASMPEGDPLEKGLYASLEVHDDGCGMAPDTIARAFDPSFSTKATGRGLGLAAVQGIVRDHHGALRIYSTRGRGTSFKILFPATAVQPERAPSTPAPARPSGGTVLVVDDESLLRRAATQIIEHFGYDALEAEDGRAAVSLFRQRAADIDVVLLDMTMPGLTGEETFKELRQIKPDARVVLSSGFNEVEATRKFGNHDLAGFLQKPYTAEQLAQTLSRVLGPPSR
ncbi:MAG: response regulator [Polyangiaceae bacterium]